MKKTYLFLCVVMITLTTTTRSHTQPLSIKALQSQTITMTTKSLEIPAKTAKVVEIFLARDVSGSSSDDSEFNPKQVLMQIIKPLDLINSTYGVYFTICTIGETGHPNYLTTYLRPYSTWRMTKHQRYKEIKVFLHTTMQNIEKVSKKDANQTSSNIYRNLHHVVHTGFHDDVQKRFLVVWSDFVESSPIGQWYRDYHKQPKAILENYKKIVKEFESDLKWENDISNTQTFLISKGHSQLSIISARWWELYLSSKGSVTKIKASF